MTSPDQPLSSQGNELLRFWKIVFFGTVLPLLILLGGLEWLGWSMGETYTPGELKRALDRNPRIVWLTLRAEAAARLKVAILEEKRPDVVIMGHSRIAQMRDYMFRPYSFYSLARVSWPFDTYIDLLRHFPDGYRPKLIIFNADFFMFGSEYGDRYRGMAPVYGHEFSEHLIQLTELAQQLPKDPQLIWKRTDYNGHPARGILAILQGNAFREDGSEQYPAAMLLTAGRGAEDLMNPAWDWKHNITGGESMDGSQMAALKQLVDLGHAKGIPMVAVQMPMYGPVVRYFEQDPHYRILEDFRKHVARGYFDQLGVPFFDYLIFPPYSEDYRYFVDAVHPGEPLTGMVVEALAADPRIHALLPRLDLKELRERLKENQTADQHVIMSK